MAVIRCLKIGENQQLRNMKTYTLYILDNLYVIIYIKFYFNSIMTKLMVKTIR